MFMCALHNEWKYGKDDQRKVDTNEEPMKKNSDHLTNIDSRLKAIGESLKFRRENENSVANGPYNRVLEDNSALKSTNRPRLPQAVTFLLKWFLQYVLSWLFLPSGLCFLIADNVGVYLDLSRNHNNLPKHIYCTLSLQSIQNITTKKRCKSELFTHFL